MRKQSRCLGILPLIVCLVSVICLVSVLRADDTLADIRIIPKAQFELSPYLYMQFMEPLGTTDGSVDAAWDYLEDEWRPDIIGITQELAPTMIRWGGVFSAYYHWREGVGPRDERVPMYNVHWGGIYSNQVGTHEFIDFNRQVGAEPLLSVNFESDGREFYAHPAKGGVRAGTAEEAAAWVDYCNNPYNRERLEDGIPAPYNVKFWQIGNETHFGDDFTAEVSAKKTLAFAKAMRKADPTIQLIGWGQGGWAKPMYETAGDELQYLAFHQGYGPGGDDSPLRDEEWRRAPEKTWAYLMESYKQPEAELLKMREEVKDFDIKLAITEGHFFLPGRNRNEVLSTWAVGVANARILNMYERNGDVLKIATLADYCGTRWQNNAVIIPVPSYAGKAYMMPVAMVMSLYRHHVGETAVEVQTDSEYLDITASRTGNTVFLHIANISRTESVKTRLGIKGMAIDSGAVYTIALDPAYEVFKYAPAVTNPEKTELSQDGTLTVPAASVSAVELYMRED